MATTTSTEPQPSTSRATGPSVSEMPQAASPQDRTDPDSDEDNEELLDTLLTGIYYDPEQAGSFFGPKKLHDVLKSLGHSDYSLKDVKNWLKAQESYTLRRASRKNFLRNRVVVDGIDEQHDVDLMDMTDFAKDNNGIRFVFMVVDIFSRYVSKNSSLSSDDVVEALWNHVEHSGRKPQWIRSDKGKEFDNREMEEYLESRGVGHFVTQNEPKANYVERWIKTMKKRRVAHMLNANKLRYVDALPQLVESHNHTHHRSFGMAPSRVTSENQLDLWQKLYIEPLLPKHLKTPKKRNKRTGTPKKRKRFAFKIGEQVRISHLRQTFSREYDVKWTGEVFTVTNRQFRDGLPIYQVKDYAGDPVTGTFYEQELQSVKLDEDNDVFKIEKVIKTKGKGRNKEHLVKWLNWPNKYNSWIKDRDLQQYR